MPSAFRRAINQRITVTPAALTLRPYLAVDLANIVSHWARLEQSLSMIFTILLAGEMPDAFASYHEVFEINFRHKLLMAVARRQNVPQSILSEMRFIHELVTSAARTKNELTYGIWAVCDDLPNSLLLCSAKSVNKSLNKVMLNNARHILSQVTPDSAVSEFIEYRHGDLTEILERITDLQGRVRRLLRHIQEHIFYTNRMIGCDGSAVA